MNVGERIGDYEIVAVLGAGGMGQVYKVRNVFSERVEAMKVLLPNMSSDPDLAQRFLREIQVQAALDHPNIARLHAAQRVGDQLVMVMELVEGSSLEKLIEQRALTLSDSVNYVSQVLDALAYAHGRGVVHRDVKPANIMVTSAGVVKLMDFGIAHIKADRRLTQTGTAVGSLYYMSPEQIQGAEPDPRSDLYALGITLYEMVTGRRPFQGDSDFSIMAAHMQQVPAAPIEIVPNVPTDLSDIIVMAIARDPAARFQSADAFHAALRSLALPGGAPQQSVPNMPPVPASSIPSSSVPVSSAPISSAPMSPPPVPRTAPSAPVYNAPPPVPSAAPPAPPPVPAAVAAPRSRRGLYMAVGSVATIAVLAAALIEIPKFRAARAVQPDTKTDVSATTTPQQPPAAEPAPTAVTTDTTPASTPAAASVTKEPAPVPVSHVASTDTRPAPAPKSNVAASPQRLPSQAAVKQTPPVPTVQQPQPAAQQIAPPVQQQVVQQPAPAAQPIQPAPPPPSSGGGQRANSAAELRNLQQQYDLLAVRAGTAQNGLRSLQQQMARQGLGLRSDMVATEGRMDLQMRRAQDAIRNGDADGARESLQFAERAIESIEKFLGH